MPATPNENARVLKTEYRSDDTPPVASAAPVITEVSKLTLRPGDVLALKVNAFLRAEQLAHVKAWFAEQLPPGTHVVVLDRNLSLQVVEQTEGEGR